MLDLLNAMSKDVWGGHRILQSTAHTLGGIGAGLLIYPSIHRSARSVGWALVGLSTLMHLYAFLKLSSGAQSIAHRIHISS